MTDRKQVSELRRVLRLDIAQREAALGEVLTRQRTLIEERDRLDQPLPQETPSFLEARAGLRHRVWRNERRRALNHQIALLRATEISRREALQDLYGKDAALSEIDQIAKRDRLAERRRTDLSRLLSETLRRQTS